MDIKINALELNDDYFEIISQNLCESLQILGQLNLDQIQKLHATLQKNTSLISLKLICTKFDFNGIKLIADIIKTNNSLTELSLSENQIGDEGAVAIAEALKTNHSITTLILGYNQIGDEGAVAIAEAFKINCTINSLNLSENLIGDKTAKFIAESLKTNHTIPSLNLMFNQIWEEGANSLLDAVKYNRNILKLDIDIYCNKVNKKSKFNVKLEAALNVNNELKKLHDWFDNEDSTYKQEIIPLINEGKFHLKVNEELCHQAYEYFKLAQKYKDLNLLSEVPNALRELADKLFLIKGVSKNFVHEIKYGNHNEIASEVFKISEIKLTIKSILNLEDILDPVFITNPQPIMHPGSYESPKTDLVGEASE